jgi:hypothetical protein
LISALKTQYDRLLSSFAFKFNLRLYTLARNIKAANRALLEQIVTPQKVVKPMEAKSGTKVKASNRAQNDAKASGRAQNKALAAAEKPKAMVDTPKKRAAAGRMVERGCSPVGWEEDDGGGTGVLSLVGQCRLTISKPVLEAPMVSVPMVSAPTVSAMVEARKS